MTDIDYAARVAKGVALLDEKWPEWATEINVDTLDVSSRYSCVTAQFAGWAEGHAYYHRGMELLRLEEGDQGSYVAHGFNAVGDYNGDDTDAAYATLNALWKGVIAERRAAADTPTEGAS